MGQSYFFVLIVLIPWGQTPTESREVDATINLPNQFYTGLLNMAFRGVCSGGIDARRLQDMSYKNL